MIKYWTLAPNHEMVSPSPKCTVWEACSGHPRLIPKERIKAVADSQQEHRLFHTHSRQPFTIPAAAPVKARSPEAFSCPLPPLPHFLCHAGPTASSCRHLSHPFFKPVPYRASMHCSCCILSLLSMRGLLVEYSSWLDWRDNKILIFMLLLLVHKANNWSYSILTESLLL